MFSRSRCCVVLGQIRRNKFLFSLATLIDLLFLGIIVAIGTYVSSKVPNDQSVLLQYFGNSTNLLIFAIIYPMAYYLLMVLLYSAAKLLMLHYYERMHTLLKISFSRFWQFYGLNVALYFSFFGVFLLLVSLFGWLLQKEFLMYVLIVIVPVFLFFLSGVVHVSHSAFIHGDSRMKFRKSCAVAFKQYKAYGSFILWDVLFLGGFYILFNVIHLVLRYTLFSNQVMVARLTQPYISTISFISFVFIFLVLGFNRVYFLEADRKHVYS